MLLDLVRTFLSMIFTHFRCLGVKPASLRSLLETVKRLSQSVILEAAAPCISRPIFVKNVSTESIVSSNGLGTCSTQKVDTYRSSEAQSLSIDILYRPLGMGIFANERTYSVKIQRKLL